MSDCSRGGILDPFPWMEKGLVGNPDREHKECKTCSYRLKAEILERDGAIDPRRLETAERLLRDAVNYLPGGAGGTREQIEKWLEEDKKRE